MWFDYILTFYYLGIKYEESVHPLNLNPLKLDPVRVNYSFELLVLFSNSITIVLGIEMMTNVNFNTKLVLLYFG